jgi:hypothetical protein
MDRAKASLGSPAFLVIAPRNSRQADSAVDYRLADRTGTGLMNWWPGDGRPSDRRGATVPVFVFTRFAWRGIRPGMAPRPVPQAQAQRIGECR